MKSLIEIYKHDDEYKNCYIVYNTLEVNSDGDPQYVWDDIKRVVNELQELSSLNYKNFVEKLSTFDDYTDQIEEGTDWQDYYIEIYYDDEYIKIIAHDMHSEQAECLREVFRINLSNEGNCIDDFIRRGVEPQLLNINSLVESIKSRIINRKVATEYHNTFCYEKDFAQISMIKRSALKIIENCEKHLERISEFYTKLS